MLARGGLIGAAGISVTGLPSPWVAVDVGTPGIAGTSSYAGGVFTLNATGSDLTGTTDDLHFVYQMWTGNGSVTARVASLEDTGSTPRAGVMFRESLAANSRRAIMFLKPAGVTFSRRTTDGGTPTTSNIGSSTAPYWVRLTRTSNTFQAYHSSDGSTWTEIFAGGVSITSGSTIYAGLICTSAETDDVCTATFDNVSVA